MKKIIAIILCLAFMLPIVGVGIRLTQKNPVTMTGTVVAIEGDTILVEPIEGSSELKASNRFSVSVAYIDASIRPKIGDMVGVQYDGQILETYPARLSQVSSITIMKQPENSDI